MNRRNNDRIRKKQRKGKIRIEEIMIQWKRNGEEVEYDIQNAIVIRKKTKYNCFKKRLIPIKSLITSRKKILIIR